MNTPSGNSQRIGPPTWVVMRLPGQKHDPLQPPANAARPAPAPGVELDQIDENVPLAAPDCKSRAEVFAELSDPPNLENPYAAPDDEPLVPQFSLAELMFLVTAAAVGLAGLRILSPAPFAAAVGGLTFLFFWLTSINRIRSRWVNVAGWGLLAIYLIAAGGALVRSWWST